VFLVRTVREVEAAGVHSGLEELFQHLRGFRGRPKGGENFGVTLVHCRKSITKKEKIVDKKTVFSPEAPAPIGPYSQAVSAGGFLWCSGAIPLDPATGDVVGSSAAEQAEQVMKNLLAVLHAGGADFSKVVRCGIFLADLADFASVNEVYGRFFPEGQAPARSTIEVGRLPRDVKVEIDAVAWIGASSQA
jgi:2-iminobutanoate/2-iminopropanoate deaminase